MTGKSLSKWEPLKDMVTLRDDFDRLFRGIFGRFPGFLDVEEDFWSPAMDIEEGNDNIVVTTEIPGMKKDDIKVSVRNNVLTVSGERKQEKETKNKTYHCIERSYGEFSRSVTLPSEVDADKVSAAYKDGVLSITLPKSESAKTKKIEVRIE
jgi:HSP20 family protein